MLNRKLKTSINGVLLYSASMKHYSLALSSIMVALMLSLIYTSAARAAVCYVSNSWSDANIGTSTTRYETRHRGTERE